MAGLGKWTASDLGEPARLFSPLPGDEILENEQGATGGVPAMTKQAARLSLELSATAYSFDPSPWEDAGWTDFSFQVDNTLLTGEKVNATGGGLWQGAVREWMQHLARSRAQRRNPISQFLGMKRQQTGEADTCKAIVMLHKMDARYVVAVGFMGTGRRIYDWVSNLRVKPEGGLHQGFLQLAREFLDNMPHIEFPKTAKELGLSTLTLEDIADEMKRADSRFVLWSSGHSQGGAVMQIVFDALLRRGVLSQNLCGWGFASPSVVDGARISGFSAYPMVHLMNGDDVTPRVGALTHLGACYVYAPTDDVRALFYRTVWSDLCFRETMALAYQTRDTAQALLLTVALLRVLSTLPQEDLRRAMSGLLGRLLPEKMLFLMDDKLDAGMRFFIRHAMQAYKDATGSDSLPAQDLAYMESRQRDLLLRYGTLAYIHAFTSALTLPHKLVAEDDGKNCIAPYLYIVRRGFEELQYYSAVSGSLPVWTSPRRTPPTRQRIKGGRFAGLTKLKTLRGRG